MVLDTDLSTDCALAMVESCFVQLNIDTTQKVKAIIFLIKIIMKNKNIELQDKVCSQKIFRIGYCLNFYLNLSMLFTSF